MNRRRLLTLGAGALGLASMGVGRFSRSTWREPQGRSDRGFVSQSQGAAGSSLLNGLLGYWSLDGNSLNRVTGLTGTDTDVTYSAGKIGQCANFNGATSKIVTPVSGPLGTFSVAFWVLPATAAAVGGIVGWGAGTGGGCVYAIRDGSTILLHDGVHSLGVISSAPSGVWVHVALTYDGVTARGYADGVALTPVTITLATAVGPVRIGDSPRNPGTYPLLGSVDEVELWDRALSAGEVAQLYNAGAGLANPLGG